MSRRCNYGDWDTKRLLRYLDARQRQADVRDSVRNRRSIYWITVVLIERGVLKPTLEVEP